jgi:hypothetical protein
MRAYKVSNMTDKTKKAFNNAIASARMEGFDFTDEQLESLADLIEQVDGGAITWQEAIDSLVKKYRRSD